VIDDALVLRVERLRDSVQELRGEIRSRYRSKLRAITGDDIKNAAAQLGERWLVGIADREDVRIVLGDDVLADLGIEFQRLITHSEQPTQRGRYESTLESILRDFRTRVVVPLKQARLAAIGKPTPAKPRANQQRSVFVGQSFRPADAAVNSAVARLVEAFGFLVVTGEKPQADSVSQKVRGRIEQADLFVGIFTRRERLGRRAEWATSAWVIDEKAYALARGKKLVLVRESGVQSIGGIQGDYEFVEFTRDDIPDMLIKLVAVMRALDNV
jgi:hypothetical protein